MVLWRHLQEHIEGSDSGAAQAADPVAVALIYVFAAGMFLCLMLMVGFQVTLDDMKSINVRAVAAILFTTFIVGPTCALCVCLALGLDVAWALGAMLFTFTPQTVAAAIFTAGVGGDTALAIVASVASCACSIVATPVLLQLSFIVLSNLDGGMSFTMPWLQLCGSLLALMLTATVGVAVNEKVAEEALVKVKRIVKIVGISCWVAASILVLAVDEIRESFFKTAFYTSNDTGTMWGASLLLHAILVVIACVVGFIFFSSDSRQRDAVIVTILRRNPGITLAIAVTFSGNHELDFGRMMSMVIAVAVPLDYASLPIAMVMRKKRFGKFCGKPPPEEEVVVAEEPIDSSASSFENDNPLAESSQV